MAEKTGKQGRKAAAPTGKPAPLKLPDDPLALIRKRKNTVLLRQMTAKGLDGRIVRSLIAETYRFLVVLGEGTSDSRMSPHFIDPNIQGKYREAAETLGELLSYGELSDAKRRKVTKHVETLSRWGDEVSRISLKGSFRRENFLMCSREMVGHQAYHLFEYMKQFSPSRDIALYDLIAEMQQAIYGADPPIDGKELQCLCEYLFQGFRF